ncbi:MAG: AraC family transcriptional regulator [Leptolyngbya sp. SIO1E4]|nr:AraC family transcriptional regulator [Leptolyngbya sp. SIO1E4]
MNQRQESERSKSYTWEHQVETPSEALKNWVCAYRGYRENTEQPICRLEVPKDRVILILGFGDRLHIHSVGSQSPASQYAAFVAGLGANPLITEHSGVQRCLEIELFPWAIHRLFDSAPAEFTQGCIHLEDLWGAQAHQLLEHLSEVPTWQGRFALVNRVLLEKVAASHAIPRPEIQWAWHHLESHGGCVPIGQLARTIGWSDRYFAARFREQVGITPKAAARRIRFNHALQLLKGDNPMGLSDIAATCGYSDQSHFAREFRLFTGCSAKVYQQAHFAGLPGIPGHIVEE